MTVNYHILKATTNVSVVIRIIDSTDGTPETGVVFNTSGIDLEYRREGAASVDITEATLAALTTAHTDGGFLHIGNGYYRLDLPDAAVATGVDGVLVHGIVTGMVVIGCYIQLTDIDIMDGVRGGMTALPNAAADAAGGLIISDAGGLDVDALNTAAVRLTAARAGALTDWIDGGRLDDLLDAVPTVTEFNARTLIAASYFDPAADTVANVTAVANDVGITAAAVNLLWNELTSEGRTAGSYGQLFIDNLDAQVSLTALEATVAALNDLSAAQVNTEVDAALADIHLDHLLAVDYNPAAQPGVATALLNELIEDNAGVSRYTVAALAQARGTNSAALATALATAQTDLDTITGSDGVTLATAQALYAPSKAGDAMDLITDALDALAVEAGGAAEIVDKLLGRNLAGGSDGGRTVTQAFRALRNRWAIVAGTLTVYREDDTTADWTSVITTTSGDPISESNPA